MTTRNRVELMHEITVLYNWSSNPHKDTISALSEKQAREANKLLKQLWTVLERRSKNG